MEIIDKTGQLRSDEEIQEALNAVKEILIKQPLVLPLFTIHAGIIMDCLRELQRYRELLQQAKQERLRKEVKK